MRDNDLLAKPGFLPPMEDGEVGRTPRPPARRRDEERIGFRLTAAVVAALIAGCETRPAGQPVPTSRKALTERLQTASKPCLQQLYLHCSHEATKGRLGSQGIAVCSMVYEALLQRGFGGDFHALHAWSRQYPDGERPPPFDPSLCEPDDD